MEDSKDETQPSSEPAEETSTNTDDTSSATDRAPARVGRRRSSSGGSTLSPAPGARTASVSPASSSRTASTSRAGSPAAGSRATTPGRLPARPGISWKEGARVEAKDFQHKWYPARIVELDQQDLTVLIHFDGWNQRYDEWLDMSSERIRPLTRHSARRIKAKVPHIKPPPNLSPTEKKTHPSRGQPTKKLEHKPGENVFAKWTDCRMYPARVLAVLPNSTYEVLFYDGFKKIVQPINIRPMPPAVQTEYANAGLLPEPGKKMKIAVRDLQKEVESDPESKAASSQPSSTVSSQSPEVKPSPTPGRKKGTKNPRRDSECSSTGAVSSAPSGGDKASPTPPPPTPLAAEDTATATTPMPTPVDRRKEKRKDGRRKSGVGRGKAAGSAVTTGSRLTPVHVSGTSPESSRTSTPGLSATPNLLLPGATSTPQSDGGGGATRGSGKSAPAPTAEESGDWVCPWPQCSKHFRKESLVDYHVKYFHTEDGSPVQQGPSRKRKKTASICSTESELSVGGGAIKHRRESGGMDVIFTSGSGSTVAASEAADTTAAEASMTVTVSVAAGDENSVMKDDSSAGLDGGGDSLMEDGAAAGVEEDEEWTDRLTKEELVNCICRINEENGLMIQCEVCLCWQHALCMEITQETLPAKYICYVCLNPPGVRNSARYGYDQDWLRAGHMARFCFLRPDPLASHKAAVMAATHALVADVHNANSTLHATRGQLHALTTIRPHSEVQFWKRNWDEEKAKATKAKKETEGRLKQEVDMGAESDSTIDMETPDPTAATSAPSPTVLLANSDCSVVKKDTDEVIKSEPLANIKSEQAVKGEIKTEGEDTVVPVVKREDAAETSTNDVKPAIKSESPPATTTECKHESENGPASDAVNKAGDVKQPVEAGDDIKMEVDHDPHHSEAAGSAASLDLAGSSLLDQPLTLDDDLLDVVKEDIVDDESSDEACRWRLLEHVQRTQDAIEAQLNSIEQQVAALEGAEDARGGGVPGGGTDVLRDVPRIKKAVHSLLGDFTKVRTMALFH